MKIIIDRMFCEGNGACVRECPELFSLDDEYVLSFPEGEKVPEELEKKVLLAAGSCPRQALDIED